MKVVVVGTGPGSASLYTWQVVSEVKEADLVLSSLKRIDTLSAYNDNVKYLGVMDTVEYINSNQEKDEKVVVAASGDTGFYSIATTIRKYVDSTVEVEFCPGISSLTYFMAKIKMGYERAKLISLHGREGNIVPYVCYNETVFTLTGGQIKAHDIIRELKEAGFGNEVTVYVGENLSLENERIVSGNLSGISDFEFSDLCVVVIHNKNYVNPHRVLHDEDFIRGKSPMTKEPIRNLSLSTLEIQPTDVVYDVGAGTGSVTCAMAYKAFNGMVYAIEKKEEAFGLVKKNIEKTGARNIKVIHNDAPNGMEDFPAPDKVFVGGSTGSAGKIIDLCLEKNPNAVFVFNAIALETIGNTMALFEERNMKAEVTCINSSRAEKLGRYNLMKADNPVYIIKGVKIDEQQQSNS